MAYSEKLIDHYENPRNVGSLDKNDASDVGTGLVGAPACGDVMKLQIQVGPDGLIDGREVQDLRLRLGDRLQLASSTEWIKGKTLDEAGDDQKHRDRASILRFAAGEDPLLRSRRGRDQVRDRRLSREADDR